MKSTADLYLCCFCYNSTMGYAADGRCEGRQRASCEDNSARTDHLHRVPRDPLYQ